MAIPTSTAPASQASSRRATGRQGPALALRPSADGDGDDDDDDGEEDEEDPEGDGGEDLGEREGGVRRVAIGSAVPVLVELVLAQPDARWRDEDPDDEHDDGIEVVRHAHPAADFGDVPQEPVDDEPVEDRNEQAPRLRRDVVVGSELGRDLR